MPFPSTEPGAKPIVLVTGAAGKIGKYATKELMQAGFTVRALTTKPVSDEQAAQDIDWRSFDFTRSLDFAPHVADCAAVVHLAAEIVDRSRMQRVNVEATRALANAAEAAGVGAFCYISSAAVYGSSRTRRVTETSPTVNPVVEVKGEHWAPPAVRQYARTKRLAEMQVTESAGRMKVIIVRPTVVVDVGEITSLAKRSRLRKMLVGRRHAHHVYVADVAAAIAWLVKRAVAHLPEGAPVAIYNVAEDDIECRSYQDLATRFGGGGADRQSVVSLPSFVDRFVEFARFGSLPWRFSLGQMMFSGERLEREGFRFPHGLQRLYAQIADR